MRGLVILAAILLSRCLSATAPPLPAPTADDDSPPITLVKAGPVAPLAISYEDLDLPMEPDTLFQDWMLTQRVRDLDGKRVRITGFMCSGVQTRPTISGSS